MRVIDVVSSRGGRLFTLFGRCSFHSVWLSNQIPALYARPISFQFLFGHPISLQSSVCSSNQLTAFCVLCKMIGWSHFRFVLCYIINSESCCEWFIEREDVCRDFCVFWRCDWCGTLNLATRWQMCFRRRLMWRQDWWRVFFGLPAVWFVDIDCLSAV